MKTEKLPCIRINCKSILDSKAMTDFRCEPSVATWNRNSGGNSEYRDIFTVYDHGEGPDKNDMPDEVWKMITEACVKARVEYAVIWLADVED